MTGTDSRRKYEMKRVLSGGVAALFVSAAAVLFAQARAGGLPACDPDNGGLTLPAGFCAVVVADNLGIGRQMAVAPNGDLFVSLRNRTADTPGHIVALRDTNGDGKFDVREPFGDQGGTGIALRNGYVYHAREDAIVRFPIKAGDLKPSGPAEVIATLPQQRSHAAKGIAFDDKGGLYVNVGAPSNACQSKDRIAGAPGLNPCPLLETSGGIWRFDENRTGQTQENGGRRYATGMRQFYALAWGAGSLYAVQHGRDQLNTLFPQFYDVKENAELPSEELLRVEEGSNFGWPYCYHDWQQGKRLQSPEYGGDGTRTGDCAKYPLPVAAYPGHWAPGGLLFYTGTQFPARYRGGVFIAFQGSWNRAPEPMGGYKVVFQPLMAGKASGAYEVFADGFAGASPLMRREDAKARPSGLALGPDGSIYISDMVNGRIWRIIYQDRAKSQ
jgi:glucose/arabinose dehydrogenase